MTDIVEHSKTAWEIASRYSGVLASETRDLAAAIDRALAAERLRAASEWRDISTAPRDGLPVELWHRVWACPITVQWKIGFISDLPWIEKTKTTAWPTEAFSHWRRAPAPPQRNEVMK